MRPSLPSPIVLVTSVPLAGPPQLNIPPQPTSPHPTPLYPLADSPQLAVLASANDMASAAAEARRVREVAGAIAEVESRAAAAVVAAAAVAGVKSLRLAAAPAGTPGKQQPSFSADDSMQSTPPRAAGAPFPPPPPPPLSASPAPPTPSVRTLAVPQTALEARSLTAAISAGYEELLEALAAEVLELRGEAQAAA